MNRKMDQGISKRDFLKSIAMGCCALGLGLPMAGARAVEFLCQPALSKGNMQPEEWKWMVEARHYFMMPRGIKCRLCPNDCILKEGETGLCRTRVRRNDQLFSIAYGNPCTVNIDPIEKKPLYHFLPGSSTFSIATAGCNLACLNCQNWQISQASPLETRNYDLPPVEVVNQAELNKCRSISYTYTEPVAFYEYTFDTAKIAHERGIKNILVSSGYIHEKPLRELCRYIDAANIDLKSFSDEIYGMLNAGSLEPVLNTLKVLKQEGVWVEITNLIVPNWSDDIGMIKKMCEWLVENGLGSCPLHFSRFQPQYKLTDLPPTPVRTLEEAKATALSAGVKFVYIGNVPGPDYLNTICPGCKKLLITRKGHRIVENNIKGNKCDACGNTINGIWN